MAKQSGYSERIKIERQDEVAAFKKFLDSPDDAPWVLNLYGRGGMGKTQLLNRFVEMVGERKKQGHNIVVTGDLIDIYWTAHQREMGIIKSIVEQLSPDRFPLFRGAMERRNRYIADPERDRERDSAFDEAVQKTFFEDYAKLKADQIVILFDTAEEARDSAIKFWCESMVKMHAANPKTRVVIAGRDPLAATIRKATISGLNSDELLENTTSREIKGFSPEHVREYFAHSQIEISDYFVERVTDLSDGRPVLIALTIDWLRLGKPIRDLSDFDNSQFERAMVEKVGDLASPFDRIILVMAHLHRRCNETILTYIRDLGEGEAKKLAADLAKFSFVKYRVAIAGQEGSLMLHDDMRDMINRYVWQVQDPSGSYRRDQYSCKILKYYDGLLAQINDPDEQNNLKQERVYYWLDIDQSAAFEEYRKLVADFGETKPVDLLDSLNNEVHRMDKKLAPDMRVELKFNKLLAKIWRGKENVIPDLEALQQDPDCDEEVKLRIVRELLWLYTTTGSYDLAARCGQELQTTLPKQDQSTFDAHMRRRCAHIYNNIGYYFRHRNEFEKAIENYEIAKSFLNATCGSDLLMARIKNNLGFVYHKVGKDNEAEEECRFALKLRQRLNNLSELGLSYNTLGIILLDQWKLTDAINYFEKAVEAFQKAEDEWGEALVNLAYGRLKRQAGFHKDKLGAPSPDREEYQQAERMLDKAIAVFTRLERTTYLAEALNEKGTLYRHQGYWQRAINAYVESALLANQIKDTYREADNYQDIAIVYEIRGDLLNSFMYVEKAEKIAMSINNRYLLARILRTEANILFKQQQRDSAFEKMAEALINFLKLDPQNLSYSAAKRDVYYQEWVEWITDRIVELPSKEIVEMKTQNLIKELERNDLVNIYPGLKLRLEALPDRFEFLAKGLN